MSMPDFFDQVPKIQMYDPLSRFLGATDDGIIEYCYADAVRLAGHSCPTVAGAYLMVRAALKALYPQETPERGAIQVTMSTPEAEGVTGVMAQVFGLITGAAADNGFHGIGGRFVRQHLLRYDGPEKQAIAGFMRVDNKHEVFVSLDLSSVPPDVQMRTLMQSAMMPDASDEDLSAFATVWQERVRRLLLEHAEDERVILLTPVIVR